MLKEDPSRGSQWTEAIAVGSVVATIDAKEQKLNLFLYKILVDKFDNQLC